MPEHSEVIIIDEATDRLTVVLNRPSVRNAIDLATVEALHALCGRIEQEPRTVIFTGGPDVFSAGADIAQMRNRGYVEALAGINSGLFSRIAKLPMPTIAAVGGAAIGAGAELAYACDFRIGTPAAKFANPETQLGIFAAAGAAWRLPELVGEPLTKEMLFAGRSLDADEALAVHLLTEIVEAESLLDAANALVDRIHRSASWALRITKLALHAPREAHPVFDNVAQAVLFETDEKRNRMDAFLTRRGNEGR